MNLRKLPNIQSYWPMVIPRLSQRKNVSRYLTIHRDHSFPQSLANWPAKFGKICCRKLWSL